MLPYFALYAFFTLGVIVAWPRSEVRAAGSVPLLIGAVAIAVMIGMRYEVRAGWYAHSSPGLVHALVGYISSCRPTKDFRAPSSLLDRLAGRCHPDHLERARGDAQPRNRRKSQ